MIVHPFPQGSPAWLRARCGIPTASAFERILTPAKLQLSAQAGDYLNELLVEWLQGEPFKPFISSLYVERGSDMESEARAQYTLCTGSEVAECGLITTDDGLIGASVDGLVGDDGIVEIKIPGMKGQIDAKRNGTTRARLQTQGQLWITGRLWVDLFLYSPVDALWIDPIRTERDEDAITALCESVRAFADQLVDAQNTLRGWGCVPAPPFVMSQWDDEGNYRISDEEFAANIARVERLRSRRDYIMPDGFTVAEAMYGHAHGDMT